MPRPHDLRRSKMRDNDADDTNNPVACWSREKLQHVPTGVNRDS